MNSKQNVTLRKSTSGDSDFAFQTKKAAFREYVEQLWGWDETEQQRLHDERFRSQEFYVVRREHEDVGIVALVHEKDCLRLYQLFILPEYQCKGIGTACIRQIISQASESELPVRLQVIKSNDRALLFYRRHGFVVKGETETHIQMEWRGGSMIRELTEHDLDEVIVLLKQLSPDPVNPDREMLRAKILEIADSRHTKAFGLEDNGRIVGMCTVGRIPGLSNECRPFAVIESVVVHEAVRRKGVGTQLVCHAMNQAEEWSCYKVVLETGTKNEGKLRFYEKCGLIRGDKTAFIKRFGF